jgi:hypothetical protein
MVLQFLVIAVVVGLYGLYMASTFFKKGVQTSTKIAITHTLCYLVFRDEIKAEVVTRLEPTLTSDKINLIINENRKLWDANLRFQK